MSQICPLCQTKASSTLKILRKSKVYYDCPCCRIIYLDNTHYLNMDEEKAIYQQHNNDIFDHRYQKFVSPIVNFVSSNIKTNTIGLDFGSGTGPVITYMLNQLGYTVKQYDPFFQPNTRYLNLNYDYIVSCEVVEHFHNPNQEFNTLSGLLKKNAPLVIMTALFEGDLDFQNWSYPEDPTHVCFYRMETFNWIQQNFKFSKASYFSQRMIVLWK